MYFQRIGEDWTVHLEKLSELRALSKDRQFQMEIMKVQQGNKRNLAKLLETEYKVKINPTSLFDVHVSFFKIVFRDK